MKYPDWTDDKLKHALGGWLMIFVFGVGHLFAAFWMWATGSLLYAIGMGVGEMAVALFCRWAIKKELKHRRKLNWRDV